MEQANPTASSSANKTSSDPFSAVKQLKSYQQAQDEFRSMVESAVKTSNESSSSTLVTTTSNKIIVNPKQRGNPVLNGISNVPWEFGDIIPDYVMSRTTCALFLSVRYHSLNPNYIHERIKLLGNNYDLRVLLVLVDMTDPHHFLNQLMKISIINNLTVILAWSPDEAGRHLETYKIFQFKPADALMKRQEADCYSKIIDALTSVKSINRSDAVVLLDNFKTLKGIINASVEQLSFCPGIGLHKARKLHSVLHENFLKASTKAN